ncbi:MAG: hypothetical protein K0S46_817 [Moraxellaceae bacterium]|jgi:Flp pilus assembly protein TadD|nr:hypothetical protein [Moraxellaceae bacterium]
MTPPDHSSRQPGLQQAMLQLAQGKALLKAGNGAAAVVAFQQVIRLAPLSPAGYRALLEMLVPAGDIVNGRKVIQILPVEVYEAAPPLRYLHARLLLQEGQPTQALPLLEALAGNPEVDAGGQAFNLGQCLAQLGRHQEAVESFRRASELGLRADWLSLEWARSAQFTGDMETAGRLYRELTRSRPDTPQLKYEQAILLLKTGQFKTGFQLYQYRWQSGLPHFQHCSARSVGLPAWDGRKAPPSLLVMREQGVGEQIVFSALLPALAQKVGHLAVAFEPRLVPLLKRTWPGIESVSPEEPAESLRTRFDTCISAADMGALVPEAIGWTGGRLLPDRERAARLREKYRQLFPGKKLVGLSWMSRQSALSTAKSVDLAAWQGVLQSKDCQFINLQYGAMEAEQGQARTQWGVDIFRDPEIDVYQDLDGLAAQMAALDVVVSTSSTTAHLAAATGAPTWVVLPSGWGLLWYWGHEGDRCAWYPEARLFRATVGGDWAPALAGVEAALAELPLRED